MQPAYPFTLVQFVVNVPLILLPEEELPGVNLGQTAVSKSEPYDTFTVVIPSNKLKVSQRYSGFQCKGRREEKIVVQLVVVSYC